MAESRVSLMLRGSSFHEKTQIYYKSIFNKYDLDKDGYLVVSELENMVKSEEFLPEIPEVVIEKLYKHDTNGDAKIDYSEFTQMIEDPELKYVFGHFFNMYTKFVVPYGRTKKPANYYRECSCHPYPLGMIMISIIEIILFMLNQYTEMETNQNHVSKSGYYGTLLSFVYCKKTEFWRFITYMLVHRNVGHLISNVAVQLLLGIALEMVHKWWRVLIVYFTGVLAGSLVISVIRPFEDLIGASGGVYALIAAHMASIIINWKEFHHPVIQFIVFTLYVLCDFAASLHEWLRETQSDMGFMAHMGGAVAGLLLGINVLRNLVKTKNEKIMCWISLVTFVILVAFSILWNIFKVDTDFVKNCNTTSNNL